MGAHERQAAERLVWFWMTPAGSAAASISLLWDPAGASGGGQRLAVLQHPGCLSGRTVEHTDSIVVV